MGIVIYGVPAQDSFFSDDFSDDLQSMTTNLLVSTQSDSDKTTINFMHHSVSN